MGFGPRLKQPTAIELIKYALLFVIDEKGL